MEKALVEPPLTTPNGKAASLTAPQLQAIREQHLREQEQQLEQLRLAYLAARAATEAVRAEIEGK